MGSLKRLLLPAALVAGFTACGGADSPDELAEEVVSHLEDADFKAYLENAVATPQEVLEVCPSINSYSVDQGQHQNRFNECLSRFDFSSGKISKVLPSLDTASACKRDVGSASEIAVTVVNDVEILTFKIKGALETENGWKATGPLDCPGK